VNEVALEVKNITKSFGAVRALREASFTLHHGEVLGLVGDNGAGKSTLISAIAGTVQPDSGDIFVKGVRHDIKTPSDAHKAGIETVFQSLSLIPALTIAENIFLNRELLRFERTGRFLRVMDKRKMRRLVAERLTELGLRLPPPDTKVAALSGGQRQAVAVARAIFWGRNIVLMDEPTAALGVRQTEIVLNFVDQLRNHGVAVIFVSHNMQDVLRACNRIIVLRLGSVVLEKSRSDTNGNEIVAAITGVRDSALAVSQ
jgi:ABC-type sugar transport system ATPase subunit